MLTMTCDRCGEVIPLQTDEVRVGGRTRLDFGFKAKGIVIDLCALCEAVVATDAVQYIEGWANPVP